MRVYFLLYTIYNVAVLKMQSKTKQNKKPSKGEGVRIYNRTRNKRFFKHLVKGSSGKISHSLFKWVEHSIPSYFFLPLLSFQSEATTKSVSEIFQCCVPRKYSRKNRHFLQNPKQIWQDKSSQCVWFLLTCDWVSN